MIRVITYGTFDLFHVGHLRLLQRAKALGDELIVGVSTDEFNTIKNKKTFIPFIHREEIIKNIKCVDLVIPENNWDQKIIDVKKYRINKFVMGEDWKGKFDYLKDYCDVIYLERTSEISSTYLKDIIVSENLQQLQLLETLSQRIKMVDTTALHLAISVLTEMKRELFD